MSSAHSIRLRAPWQIETKADATSYRRRFHRPSGTDQAARIDLVVNAFACVAKVYLNDSLLGELDGTGALTRFSIKQRLLIHNEVRIATRADSGFGQAVLSATATGDVPGAVHLEIMDEGVASGE